MIRTLDRLVSFDPKSRAYPIRTLVAGLPPRSYTWRRGPTLDQGTEGACVGFGVTGEIGARPVMGPSSDTAAFMLYHRARQLDDWPGEDYDGTAVIAGMKAAVEFGAYTGYRWAFGLDDLIMAVGYKGPAVLGVNWRDGMWDPDADGTLHVTGPVAGGHCIYTRAVSLKLRRFRIENSWGTDWGDDGGAWVGFDDMAKLLDDDGEAAIPVGRRLIR